MKSITHYIKESASKFLVNKKAVAHAYDSRFNPDEIYQLVLFPDTMNAKAAPYFIIANDLINDIDARTISFTVLKDTPGYPNIKRTLTAEDKLKRIGVADKNSDKTIAVFNGVSLISCDDDEFSYEYDEMI